ncbi:MAG: Flp family type IVb pilin [Actinomycetota bacterium]|nr:Flp family type IVb pilin [Actinomycetota bacterium]
MKSIFGQMRNLIYRVSDDQDGASLVEYALLITLIAAVAFIAVAAFGGALSSEYSTIAETMP